MSRRPLFATFDEAWAWFSAGGAIETSSERRERFTRGRAQFLTFQAPVAAGDAVTLVERLQAALADEVDSQPREHLHVSVRGAGFQVLKAQRPDEILREDVGRIGERAAKALRRIKPFEVAFGPVNVFPDAIVVEIHDGGRFAAVRDALAEAMARDSLIDDAHYMPHCTVATFRRGGLPDEFRERITQMRSLPPATLSVRRIDLARWWFTGFDERESIELEAVRSFVLR